MTDINTNDLGHQGVSIGDGSRAKRGPDMLTKVIAAIVPAVVAACSEHCTGASLTEATLEDIEDNIVRECAFDPETTDIYDEGADDSPLTPIRVMKAKLHDAWREARANMIDDVRLAIKEELRMEMYLELQQMRSEVPMGPTMAPTQGTGGGPFPKFPIDRELYVPLGDRATHTSRPITDDLHDDVQDNDYITKLNSNPLYTRVSQSLANIHNSAPVLSLEEYVSGRRFDEETLEQLKIAHRAVDEHRIRQLKGRNNAIDDGDEDEDEDEARWNRELLQRQIGH